MADWDDVRRLALALPEVAERTSGDGTPAWSVKTKLFAWERPLRRGDLAALGNSAPAGPILAVYVPDLVGLSEWSAACRPTLRRLGHAADRRCRIASASSSAETVSPRAISESESVKRRR